jgi:alpha-galactosidase
MKKLALVSATIIAAALASVPAATAAPYMGVDTWYAFGPTLNEQKVVSLVDATVDLGLARAGYRIVWLDASWWLGQRNPDGSIEPDSTLWPHGVAWLASYIHSKGLLAGIYEESGLDACFNGGAFNDGQDHVQQDVSTFAAWGFDALKVDYCGDQSGLLRPPAQVFGEFEQAIRSTGRPMILNACDPDVRDAYPLTGLDAWQWGPEAGATSWRTNTDLSGPSGSLWSHVLRNIESDAAHPIANGDGRGDPDYLMPGALAPNQARAQFAMWAMLAAPLMLSARPTTLSPAILAMFTNRRVIAIDQDRLGVMARPAERLGTIRVWVKPLADGAKAVTLLNRGTRPQRVTLTSSAVGWSKGSMRIVDVFSGRRITVRSFKGRVPGQDALVLRITRAL